jgi:hypothetical protein
MAAFIRMFGSGARRLERERQIRNVQLFTSWLHDFVGDYRRHLDVANLSHIQMTVIRYSVSKELAVEKLVQVIFQVGDCDEVVKMIGKSKEIFDYFLHSDRDLYRIFLKTFEKSVCRRLWTRADEATRQLQCLTVGAGAFISEDSVVNWMKEV